VCVFRRRFFSPTSSRHSRQARPAPGSCSRSASESSNHRPRVGSFCWAKLGEAKLIASPTSATTKRIFIVSSREFRMVCRRTICCGISHVASNILVAGAGGTPLAERSLSGTQMGASTYPESMETLAAPRFSLVVLESVCQLLQSKGVQLRIGVLQLKG
jgi:hypothetical protein